MTMCSAWWCLAAVLPWPCWAAAEHVKVETVKATPSLGQKELKLMSLNVEFYTEMCDKAFNKGSGDPICLKQMELNSDDPDCSDEKAKQMCCNGGGGDMENLTDNCRAQGCYDVGTVKDATWPSYTGNPKPEEELREPSCLTGARTLLQKAVSDHNPDIVATQEDYENYPLQVTGYVTVISSNSHPMWYQLEDGDGGKKIQKLTKKDGVIVHFVNSLLVRSDLFNENETKGRCQDFEELMGPGGKFYRCGLDLRSPEAAKYKESIDDGTEHFDIFVNNPKSGKSDTRAVPNEADKILVMASRCAAIAAVGMPEASLLVSSVHLTGGRFDDDLIGISKKEAEGLQKVEKRKQIRNLANKLNEFFEGKYLPSVILGDFNGPDDFDLQWWKALTVPWPAVNPALGNIFGGEEGIQTMQKKIPQDIGAKQLPTLQSDVDETWSWMDPPARARLKEFESAYKEWMVGVHDELVQQLKWKPLTRSDDFTDPFGFPGFAGRSGGTTSKFGGPVDFVYASPHFDQPEDCEKAATQKIDLTTGDPTSTVFVKRCGYFTIDVVPGVLDRSTDHAPVIVSLETSAIPPSISVDPDVDPDADKSTSFPIAWIAAIGIWLLIAVIGIAAWLKKKNARQPSLLAQAETNVEMQSQC